MSFQIDDMVLLLDPESYLQPFRGLARSERPATIVARHTVTDEWKLQFEVRRNGAKPHTLWVSDKQIVKVPE